MLVSLMEFIYALCIHPRITKHIQYYILPFPILLIRSPLVMLISTAKEEEEEEEEEEEDSLPKSGDDIDFPDKPRFSANKRY